MTDPQPRQELRIEKVASEGNGRHAGSGPQKELEEIKIRNERCWKTGECEDKIEHMYANTSKTEKIERERDSTMNLV
jgi:hypothetical protein